MGAVAQSPVLQGDQEARHGVDGVHALRRLHGVRLPAVRLHFQEHPSLLRDIDLLHVSGDVGNDGIGAVDEPALDQVRETHADADLLVSDRPEGEGAGDQVLVRAEDPERRERRDQRSLVVQHPAAEELPVLLERLERRKLPVGGRPARHRVGVQQHQHVPVPRQPPADRRQKAIPARHLGVCRELHPHLLELFRQDGDHLPFLPRRRHGVGPPSRKVLREVVHRPLPADSHGEVDDEGAQSPRLLEKDPGIGKGRPACHDGGETT